MTYEVTLRRDEDGMWCVSCPSLPGCHSQGATREEALVNIKNAIEMVVEVRGELGMPIDVETSRVEVPA